MKGLKKFVGDYAYGTIQNISVDEDALRKALVTPGNARNVFSDLDEFEIKSLCAEICSSGTIGQVRVTSADEICQVFKAAGYGTVIFDDMEKIEECTKYYRQSEIICTYSNLAYRMRQYYMMVAIRDNIDNIKPSDEPERDDAYGTSILNVQIAKDGSHMSIKNRYNHTVEMPDHTLNNNLDVLHVGLQSMVLGHYGFADLGHSSYHYNYIVKRGGVYLKYTTESNNVYIGDFALDENGVRFTDKSRYSFHHFRNVLGTDVVVFDNKEKKVLSATHKRNKLLPLLNRAISEGVMSDKGFTSHVFSDAKIELLHADRNALKSIHNSFAFDFQKPHSISAIMGKFTAKSLERATGFSSGIILVLDNYKLRAMQFTNGQFCCVRTSSGFAGFYAKKDFENCRKRGDMLAFFIHQDEQYVIAKQPKSSAYVPYNYKPVYDPSGCNLTDTRNDLAQRLKAFKAERRAREASEVNYVPESKALMNDFAELKTRVITRLEQANSPDDYDLFSSLLGYHSYGLKQTYEQIVAFCELAETNGFASIKDANQRIIRIKERLSHCHSVLGN